MKIGCYIKITVDKARHKHVHWIIVVQWILSLFEKFQKFRCLHLVVIFNHSTGI